MVEIWPRVLKNRAISPAVTSSDFHTEAFVVCAIRTEVTYSDFQREVFAVCAIRTELVPPSKVKTLGFISIHVASRFISIHAVTCSVETSMVCAIETETNLFRRIDSFRTGSTPSIVKTLRFIQHRCSHEFYHLVHTSIQRSYTYSIHIREETSIGR